MMSSSQFKALVPLRILGINLPDSLGKREIICRFSMDGCIWTWVTGRGQVVVCSNARSEVLRFIDTWAVKEEADEDGWEWLLYLLGEDRQPIKRASDEELIEAEIMDRIMRISRLRTSIGSTPHAKQETSNG